MASKFITFLCLIFLLLLLSNSPSAYAARPVPTVSSDAPATQIPNQELETDQSDSEMMDERCHGVGEEECLIRRTLAAHLDYVYTQKHKP
ncbi:phytosulfokines-like [Cucurbita maxima]|uniref:Phytosulfokine n=1 Tax=Cucurbita maxima TaxID=3661 RepID=A0A6J1KP44_CUCMA|nr:phytosulfokines-like [Cucurbita maxima]